MGVFYRCKCYLTNNIFLKDYKLHVNYLNDVQFTEEYKSTLSKRGYLSTDFEKILNLAKTDVEKRKNDSILKEKRIRHIQANYKPLHLSLYRKIDKSAFDSSFLKLVDAATKCSSWDGIRKYLKVISEEKRLYSFPIFKPSFCDAINEEIRNFENSPFDKGRPNSMNKYGVLMDEIGLNAPLIDALRLEYFSPIAKLLYPEWVGEGLDSHKAFTVKYKNGEDIDLSYHFDNAEVTVNICLGLDFVGGELYFGEMKDEAKRVVGDISYSEAEHTVGWGIIHRGLHMHGAMPIQNGERQNLIVWMRSSSVRNATCPMCDRKPILEKANDYGDGFTIVEK